MNETNKTSSFLTAINKYAQQQRDEIMLEVEEFKKQEIEKATQEGLKDAYALFQKEYSVRRTQIVSDIAMREQQSKKQLFEKRNSIVEQVFKDAKEKIVEYTKTDAYIESLKSSVKKIADTLDHKECVLKIREADSSIVDAIKDIYPECKVEFDGNIEIGGLTALCETESILIDETLDSKLYDQRAYFVESSGLKVVL